MTTRLLAIAACAAALGACGAVARNPDSLGDAIRSYNDGVRWGRFGVAATKIPPRERSQFIDDMDERADTVKITEYEIVDVASTSPREARVRLKMSWYSTDEGTLHETRAEQTWERHGKAWFMVGEERVRGTAMPGLPEPVETENDPEKLGTSRSSRRASASDGGVGRGNISP